MNRQEQQDERLSGGGLLKAVVGRHGKSPLTLAQEGRTEPAKKGGTAGKASRPYV